MSVTVATSSQHFQKRRSVFDKQPFRQPSRGGFAAQPAGAGYRYAAYKGNQGSWRRGPALSIFAGSPSNVAPPYGGYPAPFYAGRPFGRFNIGGLPY